MVNTQGIERARPKLSGARGKKGWYGNMSTTGKAVFWVLILVGASVGGYMIADFAADGQLFNIAPVTPTPTTPTGFSIKTYDGATIDLLDNGDFDYTLYGTDDLSDWVSFDEIEDGDSLGDISTADLVDYDYFVVRYNGTIEIEDPADEDEELDVHMYERWAQITPGVTNTLYSYQTPTTVGTFGYYSLNMTTITTTAETNQVNGLKNITLIVASNLTENNAMYITGQNFENEINDYPYFEITFNTTIAMSNFSISSTSKSRVNATALRFGFDMISSTPQAFNCIWGSTADRFTAILAIHVYYGDTLLDTI